MKLHAKYLGERS